MKIKTNSLSCAALNWAVAKCDGAEFRICGGNREMKLPDLSWEDERRYSDDWAQGGPIIEREGIDLFQLQRAEPAWEAEIQTAPMQRARGWGKTPLVAAMRCYVLSNLGDEIDVPTELVS